MDNQQPRLLSIPALYFKKTKEMARDVNWNVDEINLKDYDLSQLPDSPICPILVKLFLQVPRLTVIPPAFFEHMPVLEVLDLSNTNILSLPTSISNLSLLREFFLRDCSALMELPTQVGMLSTLKLFDIEGTELMFIPKEMGELKDLEVLRVSLSQYAKDYIKIKSVSETVIPKNMISELKQLKELCISVPPEAEWWEEEVRDIQNELCDLENLQTLRWYLPTNEVLHQFLLLETNHYPIYFYLSNFVLTIGQHAQLTSCLPRDLERKFEEFKKCLKWINAEGSFDDIYNIMASTEALFLSRHWTIEKLSDFNVTKLKYCLLAECDEMETLVEADGLEEVETRIKNGEKVGFELLQYLSIHHMKKLKSIWKGPIGKDSLSKLRILALHTCTQLSSIFTPTIAQNLSCLTQLTIEDCPKLRSLISNESHNVKCGPSFPSLEIIFLLDLPELVNIYGGLIMLEKLTTLLIYNCLKLQLSTMELPYVKKIEGENEWWNNLDCDKSQWENIFVPLIKNRALVEQLFKATNSLEHFHKTLLRETLNMQDGTATVLDKLAMPSHLVVALAVNKSRKSKYVVRWALDKFVPEGMLLFKLFFIRPKITRFPTPMGSIPISQVREEMVIAYKKEVERQTYKGLLPFKNMCATRKVEVEVVQIESDDVVEAIKQEIVKNKINKLVIGASSKGIFSRGQNLSSRISESIPSFCTVYIISKGILSSPRAVDSETIRSSKDDGNSSDSSSITNSSSLAPSSWTETEDNESYGPSHSEALDKSVIDTANSFIERFRPDLGRQDMTHNPFRSNKNLNHSASSTPSKDSNGQQGLDELSFQDICKATGNFSASNIIGGGGFGTVYKGTLKDGSTIAIKRAKKESYDKITPMEFKNEILTLSKIEHLNLVRFYGFIEHGDERIILLEYVPHGTLREHLDGKRGSGLEIGERLDIMIDVAHAVTYLHTYTDQPIIHRDIKSSKILINDKLRAKVTDFGFARIKVEDPEATHISTQVKGTAGYFDPEYIGTYQLTDRSDVYSFGVLLVELVTGRLPIDLSKASNERFTTKWAMQRLKHGEVVLAMDTKLRRNPASLMVVEKVLRLARQCVAPTRQSRPSMMQCAEILWRVRKDYHEQNDVMEAANDSVQVPEIDARKNRREFFGIEDSSKQRFQSS